MPGEARKMIDVVQFVRFKSNQFVRVNLKIGSNSYFWQIDRNEAILTPYSIKYQEPKKEIKKAKTDRE